ncbi:hypothetical protein CTEN210_07383 [Chaetoceros tenuissimus]|uniref:L-seryl-tRNA(Sec) kinase n=1 Tax=Chaetoceros tenuissimus TaxID=426638 RepID=A0AAD3CRL1_9STRA|nr:hypothetical protein CTEN210_07383 [Chaetoceros tenuissimus]
MEKNIEISVLCMCGLPAAGKSSLCKSLLNHFEGEDTFHSLAYINYDDLTFNLAKEKDSISEESNVDSSPFTYRYLDAWRETRTKALLQMQNELSIEKDESYCHYLEDSNKAKRFKKLIIMDDNFHLRSMRRDVYKICRDYITELENADERNVAIGFTVLHVNSSLDKALQNNEKRLGIKSYIPKETIRKMFETLEPPDGDKAHFERCFVDTSTILDFDSHVLGSSFLQELNSSLIMSIKEYSVQPLPPEKTSTEIEKERLETLKNTMHQVDLTLRALVGATCKIHRQLGKVANNAKKEIFNEFKQYQTMREKMNDYGKAFVMERFEQTIQMHSEIENFCMEDLHVSLEEAINRL